MSLPLISCIMPTANRERYVPLAIKYFLQQNYTNRELIIIDDGILPVKALIPNDRRIKYFYVDKFSSIGTKRNYACDQAKGDIIMHWDDDDWHSFDWISAQVHFLTCSDADICGIQHVRYYYTIKGKLYTIYRKYTDGLNPMNWVHGATMAYYKSFWKAHPFKNLQYGEDDDFLMNSGAKLCIHNYIDGFVCILHPNNTIIREFEDRKHKR